MDTPGAQGSSGSAPSVAQVVAVVIDLPDGRQQVGSGYLAGPRRVLTAEHCTRDKRAHGAAAPLRVIRASDGRATTGRVAVASATLDLAVVDLDEPLADDVPPLRYGRVDRAHARELTGCVALGYPLFQLDPADRSRSLAEIHGVIRVTEDVESGRLVLRDPMLTTVAAPPSVAVEDRRPDSPWGGLSGAVVFHDDLALGVIVEHHPRQGASAVRLLPFDALLTAADGAGLTALLGLAAMTEIGPPPTAAAAAATAAGAATVDTLVPGPSALVGRTDDLARLRSALPAIDATDAVDGSRRRAVVAVHGMGGVGKTALARAFAAEVAPRFPDARLEVDLYGFTPDAAPRPTEQVLGELLAVVGFEPAEVPASLEGRSQLWRSWLSPRRVLLVLDNVRDAAQAEPLLPGGAGPGRSLVVVTSRGRLDELDATVDVEVATLTATDAVDLLIQASRRPAADLDALRADLDALAALADRCGHLPLALRPVGHLLDRLEPAELVEVMSDVHPLEHLDRADQTAGAAFTVSYEALTPPLRDTLRATAWHPGPDFDAPSIAALAGAPPPVATVRLVELQDASMLLQLPRRRYGLHDLFLDYARRRAAAEDAAAAVREARHRLYAHLQDRVGAAAALVFVDTRSAAGSTSDRTTFRDRDHARTWLTAAVDELVASARTAFADEWPQAVDFAHQVAGWLQAIGRPDPAAGLFALAAEQAQAAGDLRQQADALAGLGHVSHARGDSSTARHSYERALDLHRQLDDTQGQADIVRGLGDLARLRGDLTAALESYREAQRLHERAGDRRGEADSLEGIGDVALLRGALDDARAAYQRSHDVAAEAGYRSGQADALCGLADVHRDEGHHDRARQAYEQASDIYQEIANVHGLAYALKGLADVERLEGRHDPARESYRRAIEIYEGIGFRNRQADCLNGLGHIATRLAELPDAASLHQQAHDISAALGYRTGTIEALEGLAAVARERGESEQAQQHLRRAEELRDEIASS
jgi:tetratricopeptide (TPR) repeat protein